MLCLPRLQAVGLCVTRMGGCALCVRQNAATGGRRRKRLAALVEYLKVRNSHVVSSLGQAQRVHPSHVGVVIHVGAW